MVVGLVANWMPLLRQPGGGPPTWQTNKTIRIAAVLLVLAAGLATFFYLPLPCRIAAPALVQAQAAQRVYVSTPGTLVSAVAEGEVVRGGQTIARLEDSDLSLTIAALRGDYEQAVTRVRHLEARAAIDADAAAELVIARELCADVEQQLAKRTLEEEALTVKTPVEGTLIPPPVVPQKSDDLRALSHWSGTPLKQRNTGCFLERGTLLCLVGEPSRHEAMLYIDGTDIQYVRPGQHVRMRFDVGPARVLDGEVVEVSQRDLQTVPPELAADKALASRIDASGQQRPLRSSYQVRVDLEGPPLESLVIGARGRAKIAVDRQTLSQRLYRVLRRALTIEM
jgi:putative peptide zinc metalloprotease protein